MIKRLIASLAFVSASAFAAGPYDGVYAVTSFNSSNLYSVHQNGSTLLVVSLGQSPNVLNGNLLLTATQATVPATLKLWDYSIGQLVGNTATLSAPESFYGNCNSTLKATFDGAGGMTLGVISSITSEAARAAGISCKTLVEQAIVVTGTTFKLTKVF